MLLKYTCLESLRSSKICQLHIAMRVPQNVGSLYISVYNSVVMEISHTLQYLSSVFPGEYFIERSSIPQQTMDRTLQANNNNKPSYFAVSNSTIIQYYYYSEGTIILRALLCHPLTPGMYSMKIHSLPSPLSVPKYSTIRSCRRFFNSCSSVSNDRTSYNKIAMQIQLMESRD